MENSNLIAALISLAAMAAALCLAAFFTLRRRLVLAVVCMLCFIALFQQSADFAGQFTTYEQGAKHAS